MAPAPLGRRAAAAAVDLLLAAGVTVAGGAGAVALQGRCVGHGCIVAPILGGGGALALLLTLQALLVAARGESVGRRLLGLRVVRADGRPAGVVRGLLLRILVVAGGARGSLLVAWFGYGTVRKLLALAPLVGGALFLIADHALALLPEGRALHDRAAGTLVARRDDLP